MKNKAFTLAEILVTLTIVGLIAIVMIKNIKKSDIKEKTNTAKAYKAIDEFNQASASIMASDSTHCPMGTFMQKAGKDAEGNYNYELTLILPDSNQEQAVLNIYGQHMKFEETGLNFCDYSRYSDCPADIPAVRFARDIYIGVEVLASVGDCPNYYMPESEEAIEPRDNIDGTKPKCWAKLYIDVNGNEAPNKEGKDIFVLGLDEHGIYH